MFGRLSQPILRWRGAGVALTCAALVALAACASDEEPTGGSEDVGGSRTVTVGYISGASLAPAFIAGDLGCYDEQKLTVNFELIKNPADAIALLTNKKIDVSDRRPPECSTRSPAVPT